MIAMTLYGNYGPKAWRLPGRNRYASFRPTGPIRRVGAQVASADFKIQGVQRLTAVITVGFNVGSKPKWRMNQLVKLVLRIRQIQQRSAGATFLAQTGVYQQQAGSRIVSERGARVIIQNIFPPIVSEKQFIADIRELSRVIVHEFKQDSVLVEINIDGKIIRQWGEDSGLSARDLKTRHTRKH